VPDTLAENLQLIADGVVAVAGFTVAAIRIRRGDELELVVDTGLPEEIGSRIPVQLMLDELELAEDWGMLQFVPHERGSTGTGIGGWIVPDVVVSDAPDAWHPMDMLVAPLYDEQGQLCGTLAIDEPVDGRRPGPERRQVLERFAALAARAVLSAVERESLAEQVAMANTVKSIVRTTSAQLSLDGLLKASERTLLDGFAAQRLWIRTVADGGHSGAEYLPEDLRHDLPAEIVAFAEASATYCWHQQAVMTIGEGYPLPEKMSRRHFDHIVALLRGIEMASLVFVPLGAGPECMGSLVLMRGDPRREWTPIECAALLDIGHDLGRAALALQPGATAKTRVLPVVPDTAPPTTVLRPTTPLPTTSRLHEHRRAVRIASVLLAVVVLGLSARACLAPAAVVVPPIAAGATVDGATELLAGVHLDATRTTETSKSVATGRVIGTIPAAGETVHEGDDITLVVSSGTPKVTVSSAAYAGKSPSTVSTALKGLGLAPTFAYDGSGTPAGTVSSVSPVGSLTAGAAVTVHVVPAARVDRPSGDGDKKRRGKG